MSHNAWVTNTDEIRRERRHASSRARRRQPLFFSAAQARKLSLSGSLGWADGAVKCHPHNGDGGGAIEVLIVCFCGSIPRFSCGLGYTVRSGCRHSCSVLCCCVSRTQNQYKYQRFYQYVPSVSGTPWVMLVMGKAGHRLQQGRATRYLPSTPAAPAPAAPGGPAVTTVDSGSDDDDDSGPNTFSNTTGQSTVPVAQQAEMTGSSRVLRVPKAEMTGSSRVPRVLKAEMTVLASP